VESFHVRGVVLPDNESRDVFITSEGRLSFADAVSDARTILDGVVLVPGLADVHCHLALASPASSRATPEEAAKASARVEIEAGVLALREPGSPFPLAATGLEPGNGYPRVVTGGRFLAPPGGYVPGFAREVHADELPEAAVSESKASGGWAKVIGDWLGPDGRHTQNFPPEALAAAAHGVHAAGGRIAIHAGLPETISAAIEAGFDSIEHGLSIGEVDLSAMAARGVTLVPTLTAMRGVPEFMRHSGVPRDEVEWWADVVERQPAGVRAAAEAGVTVLAGTDAGMIPHGNIAQEIQALIDLGLEPMAALAAGSWKARAFLNLPGIEEGAPADLVAYARDPREDASVLLHPVLVMLGGRILQLQDGPLN
jgi:imidazolonepropionase-like amidohydrolase